MMWTLLSWVGYGILGLAGAFALLVLLISLLLVLPDLLPQDVAGVILYAVLAGSLFTVAAPVGALVLVAVVVVRRRRRQAAGAPQSPHGGRNA